MRKLGRTKRGITLTLLALVAVGSTAVLGSAAASADDDKADHDNTSEAFGQPLEKILADYPNAERQPDGTYELEPGMVLVPDGVTPADAKAGPEAVSSCYDRYICAYEHRNFEGSYAFLTPDVVCGRWYDMGFMANKISSVHNNMNNVSSYFGDTTPNLRFTGRLGPNSYWRDLDYDTDQYGKRLNDRFDRMMAGCR